MPIPKAIQNAPTLALGLELFYEAFQELSSSRTIGWSEGPIQRSEISLWARDIELSKDLTDELHFYIREMDSAYLSYRREQQRSQDKQSTPRK